MRIDGNVAAAEAAAAADADRGPLFDSKSAVAGAADAAAVARRVAQVPLPSKIVFYGRRHPHHHQRRFDP